MKYYAGIGSRETPIEIMKIMNDVALKLESLGWTLRSGGADGADNAFAKNVQNKEIFLPWNNFNGVQSNLVGASEKAMQIAEEIHPAWDRCSQGAKKLHGRNIHQVMGLDLNPKTYSQFIICWTRDGKDIGGTATAIKLGRKVGSKILNLAIKEDLDKVIKLINQKD